MEKASIAQSLSHRLLFFHKLFKGVVTHYAISRLFEVISTLREKKESAAVSMVSTFFDDGKLFDDWRPLLRILHLGGHGDPYAQRAASLCLAYILLVGWPSQAIAGGNAIDYTSCEGAIAK